MIQNFVEYFARILPFQTAEVESSIVELLDEKVLTIEGDFIYQKRMVKDGRISDARSQAAKSGGGNPVLFKQKYKQNTKQTIKQKDKQIPENEIEYENEYDIDKVITNEDDLYFVKEDFSAKNFKSTWSEWINYRKKIKKPVRTVSAARIQLKRLHEWTGGDPEKAVRIVENSIANGWQGLFDPNKNKDGFKERLSDDDYRSNA